MRETNPDFVPAFGLWKKKADFDNEILQDGNCILVAIQSSFSRTSKQKMRVPRWLIMTVWVRMVRDSGKIFITDYEGNSLPWMWEDVKYWIDSPTLMYRLPLIGSILREEE